MTISAKVRSSLRGTAMQDTLLHLLFGFVSTLATAGGRAPLSIAFFSVCQGRRRMLSALCGAVGGAAVAMDFTAALRHLAILVLLYALLSAFADTRLLAHPLFRPLGAAAMCGAVELAYLLQRGITPASVGAYATYLLLVFALCHYFAILPQRQQKEGQSSAVARLRQRLELSAAAFRDLYNSFGKPVAAANEENPSVVFDRAAEQVCRGCKQCPQCWSHAYIDTFNALNDATPAMLRRGRSLPGDYPPHFRERCIHLPEFLQAVDRELTALLLRRQYDRRLEAARRREQGQYARLSEFLNQTAGQLEAEQGGQSSFTCPVGGAARPKEGEKICGDVISHFAAADGRLCLLLSDGMGSGAEANREAANAVHLLEQFLKAGVEAGAALKTINAALDLRGENTGAFTTIDLLLLDPVKRQADLYKYGAAPTYLKRYGTVRRLTGSALPAGLQDVRSDAVPIRFSMEPGTFLLLVSDGMSGGDDEWLRDLLSGWQGSDPRRLVSVLMAESREHNALQDDCSCLCLYLPANV